VSVCFYCAAVGLFPESIEADTMRRPTEAELAELLADPDVEAAVGAVLGFRAFD
jgi:hypothetical protein